MYDLEHTIIAYGDELGYHYGAKFQILSAWSDWYSREEVSVCVVTDRPDLFDTYPVRLITISEKEKYTWSLCGIQHFGIKIKGLEAAMKTSRAKKTLLLDTDSYWIKDPLDLASKITNSESVMHKDEGYVYGTSNKSINRYNEALKDVVITNSDVNFSMTSDTKMLNSSVIGLSNNNVDLVSKAYKLFSVLEPLVDAHTVEQFALAETLRRANIKVNFGHRFTRDWSSIGRKNYATPILKRFFEERFPDDNFQLHLENVSEIKLRRPVNVLMKQKVDRWTHQLKAQ